MLWFEQARGKWCRDHGFTYKQLEEMGYKLPVVEVWTRYSGEIKYDDLIEVRIQVEEIKRASIKFVYEIFNTETDKAVTKAYTWHVFVGSEMKAISIPPQIRELFGF
jgi:acyl-CoA thioester hydrolase